MTGMYGFTLTARLVSAGADGYAFEFIRPGRGCQAGDGLPGRKPGLKAKVLGLLGQEPSEVAMNRVLRTGPADTDHVEDDFEVESMTAGRAWSTLMSIHTREIMR